MDGDATWRGLAKTTRDRVLWHTPRLQSLVRSAARRGWLPPSVWRRLHPRGVWTLHAPDGTSFAYDSTYEHDGLARHIVWTDMRDWEAGTQAVLFDLAKDAQVFVDVGAYSGVYTVLACVANPALSAVAFEPNPSKLPQIRSNVTVNGIQHRVTVIGKALSAESGTAPLWIPSDDSTATLTGSTPGGRATDVPVTTGDLALDGLNVGLVKIDVEGLENEVLMGMTRVLSTHRPKIIAECLDRTALDALTRSTRGLGYRHAYQIGRAGPVPVGHAPFRPANYLFTSQPMNGRPAPDA
jgi:FkbM family methyltransferase